MRWSCWSDQCADTADVTPIQMMCKSCWCSSSAIPPCGPGCPMCAMDEVKQAWRAPRLLCQILVLKPDSLSVILARDHTNKSMDGSRFWDLVSPSPMHYWWGSIRGGQFWLVNLTSHFIRIQIFLIYFTLVFSFFSYICRWQNEHFSIDSVWKTGRVELCQMSHPSNWCTDICKTQFSTFNIFFCVFAVILVKYSVPTSSNFSLCKMWVMTNSRKCSKYHLLSLFLPFCGPFLSKCPSWPIVQWEASEYPWRPV